MASTIAVESFKQGMLSAYKETFESVMGIYLDKGTSLFETLATITHEEASRPVSPTCATLAAQVAHIRYYMDVLEGYTLKTLTEKPDWEHIWKTVSVVTEQEWQASIAELRATYERILTMIDGLDWEEESHVSGPIGILLHTAYHLGEIRQALCTIKQG